MPRRLLLYTVNRIKKEWLLLEVKQNAGTVERALLVGIRYPKDTARDVQNLIDELAELVETLGIEVVDRQIVRLREPNARYLLGSGKTEDIAAMAKEKNCDVVVFDDELSPAQQRNWEEKLENIAVIDRQEVILDIFALRARTREAVLQVGLARMNYSLPRLKRAWTHLSRQRGGGTTQRDTGETQLETDQRLVRDRISRLKSELDAVVRNRDQQRKQRLKLATPSIAIVGYTNAGKSSLLNRLTGAGVLAEDKLFATLDSTTRRLELPDGPTVLITDTVGFVRRLPHHLIEAFKATLEEAIHSDFLIHIMDLSSDEVEDHYRTTMDVLEELGADTKRILTVFNKIDLIPETDISARIRMKVLRERHPGSIFISTKTGEGMDTLLERISAVLSEDYRGMELLIPHDRYDLINRLHEAGCVRTEKAREDGVYIEGNIPVTLVHNVEEFALDKSPA